MPTIGIDLGTTNSLVAIHRNGLPILIPNSFGSFLTPSVVSFEEDSIYVGQAARERLVTHPEATFSSFKRFMGTETKFYHKNKYFTPEDLSSFVLRTLKEDAENFLGEPVTHAVISVPAYFNDDQRIATKRAGELAGLVVERVINEPSAAALSARTTHGHNDCLLLVVDLGGGTLDVSLVECFENVVSVLAVSGDNKLGGDDFDHVIAQYFCTKNRVTFASLNDQAKGILLKHAEMCKFVLSNEEQMLVSIPLPQFSSSFGFSRSELVKICGELFSRIRKVVFQALADSKTPFDDIDDVVLVGGGCKLKLVAQFIRHIFKSTPIYLGEPDQIVANGVGIYAGIKDRDEDIKQVLLTDICPFSLGVAVHNEADPARDLFSTIISRNTVLPVSRQEIYYPHKKGQKSIEVRVFQGEQILARDNLSLGALEVKIDPQSDGIYIRFTYDLNGILEVEATPFSTQIPVQKVLTSKSCKNLSPEEIEKRRLLLQSYKKRTKDEEEVEFLSSIANNIFMSAQGHMREHISYSLRQFLLELGQTKSTLKRNELKRDFYVTLQDLKGALSYDPFENTEEDSWTWYDTEEDDEDDDE